MWNVVSNVAPNPLTEVWSAKSDKALQIIVLSCHDNQLVHLKRLNSGKEAWDVLKTHHHQSTVGAEVRLLAKLFETKLPRGGSMRQHLDSMLSWIDELSETESALTQRLQVAEILISPHSEYRSLCTAIEAWDATKLTMQAVKSKLMEEWLKRDREGKNSEEAMAVKSDSVGFKQVWPSRSYPERHDNAHGSYHGRNQSQYRQMWMPREGDHGRGNVAGHGVMASREGLLCHFCRQPGHFRSDCNDLRLALKRLSRERENKESNASAKSARMAEWYQAFSLHTQVGNKSEWCIDSGASAHMCGSKHCFSEIDETYKRNVIVASGEKIEAQGIGTVKLNIVTDNGNVEVEMKDTLWIPKLNDNLVSVYKLVQKGLVVEFKLNGCFIKRGNESMRVAWHRDGLYRLEKADVCFTATSSEELEVERCIHDWHIRMAHRNLNDIRALRKEGLKIKECDHSDDRSACIKGKMARLSFPKIATPTKNVLDCVVSDLCGPMQVESIGRKKYLITFIDLHSGYTTVEFLREKSEAAEATINYIETLKTQYDKKPKIFRTDRGLEYLNGKLQSYLKKEGIRPQCTVGYAPEQNGAAERKNRTLMEAARTMLYGSGLPKGFWAEAMFLIE